MAQIRVYRTYRYIDKDPVIDEMRTILQDEGLIKKLGEVHAISGVATATLDNWFHGDTRRPQNSTIEAVMRSLGYRRTFQLDHKVDIEQEKKKQSDWLKRQEAKDSPPKKRVTNGNGKGRHHP